MPKDALRIAVADLLQSRLLPDALLSELPNRWEKHGDIVLLPDTCFTDQTWEELGHELWAIVTRVRAVCRRQAF